MDSNIKSIFKTNDFVKDNSNFYNNILKLEGVNNDLLGLALVHPSYVNEITNLQISIKNAIILVEILEMLGGYYLRLVLSDYSYNVLQLSSNGEMTKYIHNNINDVPLRLIDRDILLNNCYFGSGQFKQIKLSDNVNSVINKMARQIIGAVGYCCDYSCVYNIITRVIKIDKNTYASNDTDYKTQLQEHSQAKYGKAPDYTVLSTSGPDHDKIFIVRTCTITNRYSNGEGKSKKQAEQCAAHNYLKKYAVDIKHTASKTTNTNNYYKKHIMPKMHSNAINAISKRYGIKDPELLSEALIHKSLLNESSYSGTCDYSRLALIGSNVLNCVVGFKYLNKLEEILSQDLSDFPPAISAILNAKYLLAGYNLIDVNRAVLMGKGLRTVGLTDNNKVDIFTAFIGCLFMSNKNLLFMPNNVNKWLDDSMIRLIDNPLMALDAKTRLQQYLQLLNLEWKYITTNTEIYETHIVIKGKYSRASIASKQYIAKTIGESENMVAADILQIITILNTDCEFIKSKSYLENIEFYKYILIHELYSLPSELSIIKKWHKAKLLGVNNINNDVNYDFYKWSENIESIVDVKDIIKDEVKLDNYYKFANINLNKTNKIYVHGISKLKLLLESLDPNDTYSDVTSAPEFKELINLSRITRILTTEYLQTYLVDVLEDLLFVRKGRIPVVTYEITYKESAIYEHEGTYLLLMNEIIDFIHDATGSTKMHISIDTDTDSSIIINIVPSTSLASAMTKMQNFFDNDTLWLYLASEIPITNYNASLNHVRIVCKNIKSASGRYFSNALNKSNKLIELDQKSQNEELSRLLHDMKNQLIAYNVALKSGKTDRTSILKSKYEASMHLDNAINICKSIEAIGKTISIPDIELINIRDYFRLYIAEKITTIPPNIRIEPPKTTDDSEMYTSVVFLTSIIENLVKNSIEAMPNGGEIKIDWVYDENNKALYIEIVDNGPGIPENTIKQFINSEKVNSTKKTGTGLGMLTVKNIIMRLKGKIFVDSKVESGTQWMIILPTLQTSVLHKINDPHTISLIE